MRRVGIASTYVRECVGVGVSCRAACAVAQLATGKSHVGKTNVKFGKAEDFIVEMAKYPDFRLPRYANRLRVRTACGRW